jgi:hypothetical protein
MQSENAIGNCPLPEEFGIVLLAWIPCLVIASSLVFGAVDPSSTLGFGLARVP